MLEQGNDERSPPPEDEEAAETMHDELTITPIPRSPCATGGGQRLKPGVKLSPGRWEGWGEGVLRVDFIFSFLYSVLTSNKLYEFPL